MLNPNLNDYEIFITNEFFPKELTKKYDDYLKILNSPFKNLKSTFMESIQDLTTPGFNINSLVVNGLENNGKNMFDSNFTHPTTNVFYEGNEPIMSLLDNTQLTLTLRNNIINYLYVFEMFQMRYRRRQRVERFNIVLNLKDATTVQIMKMEFIDCFIASIPSLTFSFNQAFNESKSFDINIQFNKFDVSFEIPEFNTKQITITK